VATVTETSVATQTYCVYIKAAPEAIWDAITTSHALFDPQIATEAVTSLSFELEDAGGGVTKLTLSHELDGAPMTAALVGGEVPNTGGGSAYVLSDLKTLLETGRALVHLEQC
jgi:hypothetical protein